jgi:hypothetical protein
VSKRIVCTICGATVLSFAEPDDVDPDRLFAILERELEKHRDVVDGALGAVAASLSPDAVAAASSSTPAAQGSSSAADAVTWSRTLHLFSVVDEDNEAEDLEEELEQPELFYYGDMKGWW